MSTLVQAPEDQVIEISAPIASTAIGADRHDVPVDFNWIIQESLTKAEGHDEKGKAIIRCDKLPYIIGDEKQLKQLVDILIDLILQHQPQKSKLFIYIKSIRTEHSEVQSDISEDVFHYEICFHTNSCNGSVWQLSNQEQIAQCNTICRNHNGYFASAFGSSDCLFKLTLPGQLY